MNIKKILENISNGVNEAKESLTEQAKDTVDVLNRGSKSAQSGIKIGTDTESNKNQSNLIDSLISGIRSKSNLPEVKTETDKETVKQTPVVLKTGSTPAKASKAVNAASDLIQNNVMDALISGIRGTNYVTPVNTANQTGNTDSSKNNLNSGNNFSKINPVFNLNPENAVKQLNRGKDFETGSKTTAPYSYEFLQRQKVLDFAEDSRYNKNGVKIFGNNISDSSSLRRYNNGNFTSNNDPFGLKKKKDNSSFKATYKPTDDQYNQILNSSFNHDFMNTFAPNKKGYSEILTTDNPDSNVQLFTTQKYVEKGLLSEQGWESVTYVFVTLPVSEWKQLIETVDFYNEKLSKGVGDIISFIGAYFDDRTGWQVGEAASMLYQNFDNWASTDLENVVVDKFSRYLSKKLSNKESSEEVSLLVGAYSWERKEDSSTGEWNTTYLAYGYPWSQELNFFN